MSLMNDAWIRRMVRDHQMIQPFQSGQVRSVVENLTNVHSIDLVAGGMALKADGDVRKVISYGVSSYGYDLRVADEFKVFSAARGGVIDPKNFDECTLVDVSDDVKRQGYCLIPPNSFALARSIERFKIPRNILTLCIGKSSYARCGIIVNVTPFEPCLSADSEILASDGWRSMVDVKVGDYVLTRREDGLAEYQPVKSKQAREFKGEMLHFAGRNVDQLTTPDHKLFVWRRNSRRNTYEGMTIEAREVFGRHNYSFDRQVEWAAPEKHSKTVEINGAVFPFDAFLQFLGCWLGDGSAFLDKSGGYMVKLAAVTKERKFVYFGQVLREMGIDNARRHERGWHFYNKALAIYLMQFGHAREKYIDRRWMGLAPDKLGLLIDGMIESDGNRETMTYTTTSRRLADDFQEIVFKSGSAAIVREVEADIDGCVFDAFKIRVCDAQLAPKMPPRNHKTVSYDGMVYDITVPNHVFFMRRDGKASWTGNCWEGWPTLEISNTTPLPAKVYANEGIAQVLFFEADEVCERSYADRLDGQGGKYQNQGQEIVPPRM